MLDTSVLIDLDRIDPAELPEQASISALTIAGPWSSWSPPPQLEDLYVVAVEAP